MRTLFLLLFAATLAPLLQADGGRHALILCNQSYKVVGELRTPLAEAREAEKTLATLGFAGNITVVTDATTAKMIEAVDTFASKLNKADVALFFYGGHAVQVAGENYLLGVDSDPTTASQLAYKALPLGRVLTNLEGSGARLNLLILDCCRDNPLPATGRSIGNTRGLAAMANAPKGTFIAYAADANQQAWDDHGQIGLYGTVLFEKMKTPGLRLEDIFIQTREEVAKIATEKYKHQQEPAEYSKVSGAFYLNSDSKPSSPPAMLMPTKTPSLAGKWSVREQVEIAHGGWLIEWEFVISENEGELAFEGKKKLVNNKLPSKGELAAVAQFRLPVGQLRSSGKAIETNFRGEKIVSDIECLFSPAWHSFEITTTVGGDRVSKMTGIRSSSRKVSK
jgi:hypothetical protein